MSEALYNAVKSGRVKLEDLNDDGKTALRSYMQQKGQKAAAQPAPTAFQQAVSSGKVTAPEVMDLQQSPRVQAANKFAQENPEPDRLTFRQAVRNVSKQWTDLPILRPLQKLAEFATPDSYLDGRADDQGFSSPRARLQAQNPSSSGNETWDIVSDFAGKAAAPFVPTAGIGMGAAGLYKSADVKKVTDAIAKRLGTGLKGKVAQEAAREGIVGAPLLVQHELATGDGDPRKLLMAAIEGGIGGAASGAALPLAGAGFRAIRKAAGDNLLAAESRPELASAVKEFIAKTERAPATAFNQSERIVRAAGGRNLAQAGDELAGNFKRSENIQKQYKQAIDDQYTYLKQSMDERGGVQQGGVIKDPVSGEVVNRYGRISNNPKWYQDFFAENGRKPSDADLRKLAEKHVREGFQDEVGRVPAWKPREIDDIDGELSSIREGMKGADPESMSALEQVTGALSKERASIKRQLPEGVQAFRRGSVKLKRGVDLTAKSESQIDPTVIGTQQQYAGNPIPFRQAATQSDRTINRNQVVKNLRKNLGVVIDTGRLRAGRGVLGLYKVKPEVVRTGMAEDLQVISHEVGHHLDKKHGLQDPTFIREYVDILNANPVHNTAAYSRSQIPAEGVAEYIRLRLTDPAKARQLAPRFSQFFDSKLPPKTLEGLEASQRDIDTWITQGDYEQAKGLIDFESGEKKQKFSWSKFYDKYVDDLNPIKLAEKALSGAIGIGNKSIYKMARLSRGIGERAKMAVTRGIYDAKGNKISDGLQEIVKPLEDLGIKEKDFSTYLAVRHAMDLKKLGKNVPFTDDQMNAVMRKLDIPEVQDVQKKIIKFNNALLDILVDAQILSSKSVSEMRKKYPNYVPFMRYFDDDAVAGFKNGGFGAAKGFANITNPVKRMSEEGSFRTIVNPMESIVKNTFLAMNAAAKNKVGLQLAKLSKVDGAGAWVEHLGKGGRVGNEHIVSVFENGVQQQYKVRDPELYNAMLSLDNESTNSLIKFLGGAASMLRAGATLTPEFLIRNAFRDVAGAIVNSTQYGFNPLDFFKGLYHVLGKTKTFDQFISSGGAMSTMMALDRDANREALENVFRESMKDKALNIVKSPKEMAKFLSGYTPAKALIGGLRKAAEVSELSTKVGAFNKVLNQTGSVEEAAYTARDLMDFNRAGSSIRQANKAVAFLNASIQGTDRMARAFKDNKASFLTRAFSTLVLPASLIYMWNQNLPPDMKEEYDNIPQWQKDSFFVLGIPGINKFVRIPKPFEAGMLFATGTERSLRWLQENDPDAFKNYGKSVAESLTPPMLFTALTPMLEATTNHSFFRNAPIVPQGEQRFEKKDQYGLYTSETAKKLGQLATVMGLGDTNAASPRIIDNTIKGYTAGLGQYAIAGLDKGINLVSGNSGPARPAQEWSEQPFLRAFFSSTGGGGQIRQDFYDKWDDLSKKKASADRNEETFNDPKYNRMKGYKTQIDALQKQYKFIQQSKNMNPSEKRSKLDDLDDRMNEMAKKALGK